MVIKVDLDYQAVGAQVLYAEGARQDLTARAARVAAKAGPGHASRVQRGRDRYRASIWTATYAARRAEAKNHTLLKALDAAR